MSDDARLARLEQRLMVLEELVRQGLPMGDRVPSPSPVLPQSPMASTSPVVVQEPTEFDWLRRDREAAGSGTPERPLSAEQWMGQRGVLAIGVLLLIMGGAYFLKIAIDRGWVSPAARCIAAILAGQAIAAIGWRAHRKGLESWGATMIGAGEGIVYLAVWAAARWYTLVSPELGIVGLAGIALSTSAIAVYLGVEALGMTAALGALLGPVIIGSDHASATALLLYLTGVGATLGVTAVRQEWRTTTLLIVGVSLLLALGAGENAQPLVALAFAVLSGASALWLRRRWPEVGMIGFIGAWRLLTLIPLAARQPLGLIGALVLAAIVWWDAFRSETIWPDRSERAAPGSASMVESLIFYLTPLMLAGTIAAAFPAWIVVMWRLPLLVAVGYLLVGYGPRGHRATPRIPFAVVGASAAAIAALTLAQARVTSVMILLGLTLLWAGLDHVQHRRDGRWYALATLALAGMGFADLVRDSNGAAFRDPWAMLLWLMTAVTVALARGLWFAPRLESSRDAAPLPTLSLHSKVTLETLGTTSIALTPRIPAMLWVVAGALLFGGVTSELYRQMFQLGFAPEVARLASSLVVSAWWAAFAGILVVYGFYRKLTPVRVAGLMVGGLAAIKVLFFDLANLDELYRVGSFVVTAIVLLLMAFLYHRQAARSRSVFSPDT